MIKIIVCVIIILLSASLIHSQTRRINSLQIKKDKETISVEPKKPSEIEGLRKRIPIFKDINIKERKPRRPVQKLPNKKKKREQSVYVIEENGNEENVIESTTFGGVINNEFCNNDYHFNETTDISRNPYVKFPLQFLTAEVNFMNSRNSNIVYGLINHFYELKFSIKAHREPYFHSFGILIKCVDGYEKLLIFNRNEEILFANEPYEFKKRIKINKSGFVNILIGFYDEIDEKFYEEPSIPNKNDFLLYLHKPN